MDAFLLRQAAAQAKTSWLEQALKNLLPHVWNLTTESPEWQETAFNWANQIDLLFEEKKLNTPGQQKNRRTDIANALRTFNPNHPVIPFILLTSEVYTQLNNEQAKRLNARVSRFFSIQQANELVEKATALLGSEDPDEIGAGLAVLVGRRISEVLISQFKLKTDYSLLFSEAVKRRGEIKIEFEIPTLASADRVLDAITYLKRVWNIKDLRALNLPENQLKRRINARYSGVPHACRRHFADLIPGRKAETDEGERLYTHLFRAVYAEIATYYYKPSWVPDHRFKAEVQGHFKLTTNGQKIPSYSARQNYDDYLIQDRFSGAQGVKLGLPGVEILEIFRNENKNETKNKYLIRDGNSEILARARTLSPGTINALVYRAGDRLLFSREWAEAGTGLVLLTGRTLQTLMEQRLEEKAGFSILVDGLEVPTLTGAGQVVAAWRKWQGLEPLPKERVSEAIRKVCELTFGDLVSLQSISDLRAVYSAIAVRWFCPPEVEKGGFLGAIQAAETAGFMTAGDDRGLKLGQPNVQILEGVRALKVREEEGEGDRNGEGVMVDDRALAGEGDNVLSPMEMERSSRLDAKPRGRHRRKTLSVDPDLLRTVAASFDIEVRGRGGAAGLSYEAALGQILERLALGLSRPDPKTTSTFLPDDDDGVISVIKDQARTLAWLTGRVESLEQRVESLKRERDEAIAQGRQLHDSALFQELRLENQRLKQEWAEAGRKLEAFRRLLLETEVEVPRVAQWEQELAREQDEKQEKEKEQEQQKRDELRGEGQVVRPLESAIAPSVSRSSLDGSERLRPSRKRIPEPEALDHIRRAVKALFALNDQEDRLFKDKWYISFPVVQTLLRAHGLSANQKLVAVVFQELKQDLELHHDRHHIGSRHNRTHPDLAKIAEIITLDQLIK